MIANNNLYFVPTVVSDREDFEDVRIDLRGIFQLRRMLTLKDKLYFTLFRLFHANKDTFTFEEIAEIIDTDLQTVHDFLDDCYKIGTIVVGKNGIIQLKTWKRRNHTIIPRNFIKQGQQKGVDFDKLNHINIYYNKDKKKKSSTLGERFMTWLRDQLS